MSSVGCMLCPRKCGADRITHMGACNAPILPYIAKASLHMWEEPFISGKRGSGTIFFCGCNMKCVFCQNYDISTGIVGKRYDAQGIADIMLRLQDKGAHNINLVSPAPFVPVIMDADLGHLPPMMPLVTGSMARIEAEENRLSVKMEFQ